MKCLACNKDIPLISNEHLTVCCGLTLQEYALRYGQSLDVLVPPQWLNREESTEAYPSRRAVSLRAQIVLSMLQVAGLLRSEGDFFLIPGEIRKLDQLLWLAECLEGYGFQFRQEYIFNQTTHRVVAVNQLKARRENISSIPQIDYASMKEVDLLFAAAILVAVSGYFYGGYVFLELQDPLSAENFQARFAELFSIRLKRLKGSTRDTCLLRAQTSEDSLMLLNILKPRMMEIPQTKERYYQTQPLALVVKELVFDAAHFITDHPDKCANLHGGRYNLLVKVHDRIDPYTGFVVDYGYLKKVVKRQVIEQLDHKSLNFSDTSLAWRSSTELVNLFIWEQLIDYLPNLYELQTYETPQSYCSFRGPSLDEFQKQGGHIINAHFQSDGLGGSPLRRHLDPQQVSLKLKVVK